MSNLLKSIIENDTYKYISITIGCLFLVPQTLLAWKTGSLQDMSSFSLTMLTVSGILWSIYMYDTKRILFFPATVFLTSNSLFLLLLKCHFYRRKLLNSMARLDNPLSVNV